MEVNLKFTLFTDGTIDGTSFVDMQGEALPRLSIEEHPSGPDLIYTEIRLIELSMAITFCLDHEGNFFGTTIQVDTDRGGLTGSQRGLGTGEGKILSFESLPALRKHYKPPNN
jgi:hypothetical protein